MNHSRVSGGSLGGDVSVEVKKTVQFLLKVNKTPWTFPGFICTIFLSPEQSAAAAST